MTQITKHGQLI